MMVNSQAFSVSVQRACLQSTQEVLSNDFYEREWDHRAPKILAAAAKGYECFDCQFYKNRNGDLREHNCHDAFSHFINEGQFQARAHRYDAHFGTSPSPCTREPQ